MPFNHCLSGGGYASSFQPVRVATSSSEVATSALMPLASTSRPFTSRSRGGYGPLHSALGSMISMPLLSHNDVASWISVLGVPWAWPNARDLKARKAKATLPLHPTLVEEVTIHSTRLPPAHSPFAATNGHMGGSVREHPFSMLNLTSNTHVPLFNRWHDIHEASRNSEEATFRSTQIPAHHRVLH